ncbi:putative nucleotidyltransferase, Ribonuclease H [Helianthus annuus]|nr:putative nucleotidyltransferase, Ribonuclease H [Helianthus annuus]
MPPRRENPTMEESIAALAEALSSSSKENSLKIDALTTQIAAQAEQTTLLIAALTKTDSKPSSSKPPLPENNLEIRPPKLILSTFDGTNPLDWLFQAEQYFAFYKTDPSQRLTIASFSMSGEALSWYIYLHNNKLLTTWDEFTRMLEIRFGPSSYENHQAALFKLCQTSTVTAYITEFERLSNCVVGLPPDALLNCFLSGLRKDIQKELAIHKPQSLAQAVGLAKLVDDKLGDIQYRPKLNPPFRATPTVSLPPIPPTTTPKPSTTNTSTPPILPTPTITNQTLPFNRLSHEALQQRKAAGLCFRCPEKYHRGHRCNPPQFHLIVDNDEPYEPPPLIDFSEDQLPQTEQPTQSQSDTIIHKQFLSLSPAALLGVASPKALRVTGLIAGHSVSILIDSGTTIQFLNGDYFPWLHELRDYYTTTKEGRDMIRQIAESPDQHPNQQLHDGLIYRDAKLFIPIIPSLRLKLLHEFHSSKVGGHSGITATIKRIKCSFYWSNLRDEVTQYINNCKVCQQTKYSTQKPYGLLQPLPIPNQVWEEISMDFITNLPPSNGKTAIWVIVDRLTKFAHFISLRPNYTATSLATIFLDQIYKLHGLPKSILSDRDPVFVSKFWKELFNSVGTTLLHSSAYHPQTDGQTEVVNRTLESYLRCFACDEPNRWTKYLYLAEFWYNTSHHSAIDMTPFQALYGRPPPSLPHYTLDKNRATTIEETLLEHQRVLDLLKSTLQITRQRMADQANKHRQDKEFSAGDLVLLRLRMYRQQSVAYRGVEKLSRRYYGPFMIIERIGKVAYRLALPPGSRIHPVFHVSLLRACKGDWQSEFTPLPPDFIATVQLDDGSGLEGKAVFEGRDNVTTHVSDTGPTMQSRPKRVISKPIRFLN